MVEIEEREWADRVVIEGLKGRRLAWLGWEGKLETTTLTATLLELPRCPVDRLGAPVEAVAASIAAALDYEVHTIVHWPPGSLDADRPIPEAVGILWLRP
jgi:hypothetical protein